MLKRHKFPISVLAAGASLVAGQPAFATPGSAPKLVPFHATFAGSAQTVVVPPRVFATGAAEGRATHLGATVWDFEEIVTLGQVVPGCPTLGSTDTYTGRFIAANGDMITVEGAGTGCPTSPTTVIVMDVFTVTGGTGRFEGASGNLTSVTAVDRPTNTFVITFQGELSTPGSIK